MTVARPEESVAWMGWDRLPQAALGLPVEEKDTGSLAAGPPPGPVTVAVMVEVLVPFPARVGGVAETATELAGRAGVWVTIAVAEDPVLASEAVRVQKPEVVEDL